MIRFALVVLVPFVFERNTVELVLVVLIQSFVLWLGCVYLTQMCFQEDEQSAIRESRGLECSDSLNKDVRHEVVEVL